MMMMMIMNLIMVSSHVPLPAQPSDTFLFRTPISASRSQLGRLAVCGETRMWESTDYGATWSAVGTVAGCDVSVHLPILHHEEYLMCV
jgi:hypothetical protein